MSRNYLSEIERYHDNREALQELLGSILHGIAEKDLMLDAKFRERTLKDISHNYGFITMFYMLDANGVQLNDNFLLNDGQIETESGEGKDRSQRPYFLQAKASGDVVVTEPYLSCVDHSLCLSSAIQVMDGDKVMGYMVLDLDLSETIRFLMGDHLRTRFEPVFKVTHAVFSLGLFAVVGMLLFSAFSEMTSMFSGNTDYHQPFTAIIYLTLGMAIFDLAKTTLEEEVLTHKDIFRHSTTRRTITRFMASILVAVSIEALLLMFKGAMGQAEYLSHAALIMISAVVLLIGLGVYVYLGAKAEKTLIDNKRR